MASFILVCSMTISHFVVLISGFCIRYLCPSPQAIDKITEWISHYICPERASVSVITKPDQSVECFLYTFKYTFCLWISGSCFYHSSFTSLIFYISGKQPEWLIQRTKRKYNDDSIWYKVRWYLLICSHRGNIRLNIISISKKQMFKLFSYGTGNNSHSINN